MWTATTLACVCGTLATYLLVARLYQRYRHPAINVVGLSAAVVIIALLVLGIPYSEYEPAKRIMTTLMGAATVSLALPLYRYRKLLLQNAAAILTSVGVGALTAMFSAALMVQMGGLGREITMSILAKGVTIPFAVELASIYNGIPSLATAFVVATGTLGSLLGAWTLDIIRVNDPFARGLALGTMAHGQGVAAALLENEQAGAMAGLAMILAGILTSLFAPPVVWLLDCLA